MSILVFLKLDDFLAQWFINDQGGRDMVELKKGTMEYLMLEQFLIPAPSADLIRRTAYPGEVTISVPSSKHKDFRKYNYLSEKGRIALRKCIRNRFIIQLWNDLYQFDNVGLNIKDLVFAWMEAHGITCNDTNFNTIIKIYLRQRNRYYQRERRRKIKES